ncbi:MAG TPA: ATP synthase F0 subunit B [Candidatus Acidoferrales bacterium]|nr:ATP synthase F0 subunit B [Candidatus Acidoferrales bacterium]
MMRRVGRLGAWLSAMAFMAALYAAPVLAQSNPADEANSTTGWVYRWINFGIFAAVLIWAFAKKTPPAFRHRREVIGAAIAESTRAREEAERQQREAETKMATLEKQVEELRARAKKESAAEVERIRALAQEEAKRIEQAEQMEIRAAERAAQLELKAIAARMAVERAEALLQQQMTPTVEAGLFRGFVADLQGSAN